MNDSWIDQMYGDNKDYFITNSWNYLTRDNSKSIPVDTGINTNCVYNVTPDFIKSFREAEARMEKEIKEKELREKQIKNKCLRNMIKKVIINEPCTIIMWNDGTKTVTKCHEFDSYDPEKGILACMAKKLYKNTNLFNEVIQEYVDFDAYNIKSEENECLEQANKTIAKLQTTLDAADSTIYDLEKELTYNKRLVNQMKADTQICEGTIVELQEKINNLEAQKETLLHRLEDADNRIEALEDEVYWNECEINDLREELYEAQTDCSE